MHKTRPHHSPLLCSTCFSRKGVRCFAYRIPFRCEYCAVVCSKLRHLPVFTTRIHGAAMSQCNFISGGRAVTRTECRASPDRSLFGEEHTDKGRYLLKVSFPMKFFWFLMVILFPGCFRAKVISGM
ncbi:hypothetical protein Tcan_01703 [Toxocara canis]|uniref:Uncharacterized protein n=1 Tax=Toxocara canis TaxID=6265 RepID=A0A0B2VPL9_TOXCA|nr:hypothetical protein Tcan_01703 [Toxocara canis]